MFNRRAVLKAKVESPSFVCIEFDRSINVFLQYLQTVFKEFYF